MNNLGTMYHIYPLGFCDAPIENDGILKHRIKTITKWIPHLQKLNVTSLYLGPIFQSDAHGYDTRDYRTIDCRLGNEKDVKDLCNALHKANIKVLFDGVFNHVGRGFFAFQDVLEKKWDSPYVNWFYINFDDHHNQDGFGYANWEGHPELVKLNLGNPEVVQYLLDSVQYWIDTFHIDGLRLDVAYCIDKNFLWQLHHHAKAISPDFFLFGEMIHGDYNQLLQDGLLDSVTNYECQKGLHSSFNSKNFFEISYSLNRQFGKEQWCLYTGKQLVSFADNHDVNRIASTLEDKQDLPLLYTLLFCMPGIPCIYYGSEWGAEGLRTSHSDRDLRPSFEAPEWNALSDTIATLAKLRNENDIFQYGDYENVYVQNQQLIFKRAYGDKQLYCAINKDSQDHHAHVHLPIENAKDALTKESISLASGIVLPAKRAMVFVF